MKWTRLALLVLMVFAVAAVVTGYRTAQKRNQQLAPSRPAPLPAELNSTANNWSWSQSAGNRSMVEATAQGFRQVKDSSRFELQEVKLKIFSKDGDTYDLVHTRRAEFDQPSEKLFGAGEVTIVVGLPAHSDPLPGRRYLEIHTSGLTFDNKSGVAWTERQVEFRSEAGDGSGTGAVYDSAKHYLRLKSNVDMLGLPPEKEVAPGETPPPRMHIRAGELYYYEADQKVLLQSWCSLERGSQGVKAANAIVHLADGQVNKVEAVNAQGWDISPEREVHFSSPQVTVELTRQQTVDKIRSLGGVEIVSRTAGGVTRTTGNGIDMDFVTPEGAGESQLSVAYVRDHGRIEEVPAEGNGRSQPERKVLLADFIKLVMLPGGQDIQSVESLSPGRLEFLPSAPLQWKRILTAEHMSLSYLPDNRPQTLKAAGNVHTENDPPAPAASSRPRGAAPSPRLTWSTDLEGTFDAQTAQMKELRQWGNFRYVEGPRQGKSSNARFDMVNDRMYLDTNVRVRDETSVTTADSLALDERQDRMQARGHVTSTHQEAQPRVNGTSDTKPEAIFDSARPMQAIADELDSEQHNKLLHYRGAARLWQEGNSVQADAINLDRSAKSLEAHGHVVSVLSEQDDNDDSSGQNAPAGRSAQGRETAGASSRLVMTAAESLYYTDESRKAVYSGRVVLKRDRMTVRTNELESFLRPRSEVQAGQSRLDHAIADGQVEIRESGPLRPGEAPRRATAEHAEYFSNEGKVILTGGSPTLEQPGNGFTRGSELTYYIDDDKLLVNGQAGARSLTRRKLNHN